MDFLSLDRSIFALSNTPMNNRGLFDYFNSRTYNKVFKLTAAFRIAYLHFYIGTLFTLRRNSRITIVIHHR